MPNVAALYSPVISTTKAILKADGGDTTLVTFELKDAEGNLLENAEDVEIAFTTTFGSFAENRVSVQNGKATVLLTSEFLTQNRVANLRGLVVEAADSSLIGLKAEKDLLFSPNPSTVDNETIGASMTNAESNQADRIIAYFNKDVKPEDYLTVTGALDSSKVAITVNKNSKVKNDGTKLPIKGLLPVPGNPRALQIMLDVEAGKTNALTDNADVYIEFVDKTGSVSVTRDYTFKLTDARKPSMLSVQREGLNKIIITFSEAVISDGTDPARAENPANWTIDGFQIDNLKWNATAKVGQFTPNANGGVDKRNIVEITLGTGKYFTPGTHSVQAANIGDWAALIDPNNRMNTQTLDFVIPQDNDAPIATIEVQSPEQWLVTYNRDVIENEAQFAAKIKFQGYNTTTGQWVDNYTGGVKNVNSISTTPNTTDPNLDLKVKKLGGNKFIIQTDLDWTVVHNTSSTNKNYYNYNYRLQIPVGTVTNGANGRQNVEQNLTLGGAMTSPDVVSPKIDFMVETLGSTPGTSYDVTMTEPVKLSTAANNEGETLAQGQTNLPVPKAEFIKSDNSLTIPGVVSTSFVDDYNKVLRVTPNYAIGSNKLPAGNWTLVIRSISDDVGNTTPSATETFTVAGPIVGETDFEILWAFADEDTDWKVEDANSGSGNSNYDYVVVKFSKPVSITGDQINALKTSNYTFNGQPLPLGTQIFADIAGYDDLDNVVDSITIRLPQGALYGQNAPHVLNVSPYLKSAQGDALKNPGEKVLAYNIATINADILARVDLDAVKVALDAMANGIDAGEIVAFETAYLAAETAIDNLASTSLVKAQYKAALASYLASVKSQ